MNSFNTKTTIYDIFGYLIPGIFFYILYSQIILEDIIFSQIYNNLAFSKLAIIIVGGYILGHALSAISSLIFEPLTARSLSLENILSKNLLNCFKKKFIECFNFELNPMDFRTVICYVETYRSSVYSTAFVFLLIYWMCRGH